LWTYIETVFGGQMEDCLIQGCRFQSPTAYILYATGDRNQFLDNDFRNSPRAMQFNGCSGPYGADQTRPSNNCVIERNRFQDLGNRAWLYRPSNAAIIAFGGDGIYLCPSQGTSIQWNVFSNIACNIPRLDSGGWGARIYGTGNVFANNKCSGIGVGSVWCDNPSQNTLGPNEEFNNGCSYLDASAPLPGIGPFPDPLPPPPAPVPAPLPEPIPTPTPTPDPVPLPPFHRRRKNRR
jgi:hypothetical protein